MSIVYVLDISGDKIIVQQYRPCIGWGEGGEGPLTRVSCNRHARESTNGILEQRWCALERDSQTRFWAYVGWRNFVPKASSESRREKGDRGKDGREKQREMETEMKRNSEPNRNRSIFVAWKRDEDFDIRAWFSTNSEISLALIRETDADTKRRDAEMTKRNVYVALLPRERNLDSDDDPRWCRTTIANSSSRSRNEHGNPCHRLLSLDIQPSAESCWRRDRRANVVWMDSRCAR